MIWPTQKQCDVFYGNPRHKLDPTRADPAWEMANLVRLEKLPFVVRYDGRPIASIRCHKLVVGALRDVLESIWHAAGNDQRVVDAWGMSVFAGSYNYRQMRELNTLSMHSYGIAFDFDPARNGLHDNTPHFAQCPEVLKAWRDVGAVWGGDWNGNGSSLDERRCDGMHWQFARLG